MRFVRYRIKTNESSKVKSSDIIEFITQKIDLTPKGIRNRLKMNNPIYKPTASFGHFGREPLPENNLFLWEETNLYTELKQFGLSVDVYDPHANSHEVEKEYGIKLSNDIETTFIVRFDV